MNSLLRSLIVVGCLAALSTANTWSAETAAKQPNTERKVVATIRPILGTKPVDLPALAKIPFEKALKTALNAMPGEIIKAELEIENGNLMYSFEIVTRQKVVMEVEIDAGDGKVLDIDHD